MTATRHSAPPPLLQMNVEIPAWPVVDRARRRLDVARSLTGRLATVAGAAAAALGLFTGEFAGTSLLATVALSGAGLVALRLWQPGGHQRAAASVLYLMPGTALAALLIAERVVAGIHWGEALALAVWTSGTWVLRPARVARRMISPPPVPAPSVEEAPVEVVDAHPAARWWAANVAVDGGAAPGTLLTDIERTGETSMRAVIRSAIPGEPVPDISTKRLSALMDVPEDEIDISGVPGRGAGLRQLSIGSDEAAIDDPATYWEKKIAPKAMPGTRLAGVRTRPAPAAPVATGELGTEPADRPVDQNGEQ